MTDDSTVLFFQLPRKDLVYLKFILEAYEGMSTLSTADKQLGIVRLSVPNRFLPDMTELLASLGQEISLQPATDPNATLQE